MKPARSLAVNEFTTPEWDFEEDVQAYASAGFQGIGIVRGSGSVVNTSSLLGLIGAEGCPAYVASKHAVVGLTKTAALEYAQQGIRVNAVCPGTTRTPMLDRVVNGDPKVEAEFIALEPTGRFADPEEVAEAVLWLSSDAASFVTGHTLSVDGGRTAL